MCRFTDFLVAVKLIFLVSSTTSISSDANLSSVEILKSVSILAEVIIRGSFVVIVDVVDDDWDWDVNGLLIVVVMCRDVGDSGNKVW